MHHSRPYWTLYSLVALLMILAGCRRGEPLEYVAAMNLLRDSNTGSVVLRFSASPPDRASSPVVAKAYGELAENHILDCSDPSKGNLCIPGPAGGAIRQDTATALSLAAGHWAPGSITSLQRTGSSTATGEVRMTFEPSTLYREFERAFDTLRTPNSSPDLDQKKDGKVMKANFQRLDDGWHLESLE